MPIFSADLLTAHFPNKSAGSTPNRGAKGCQESDNTKAIDFALKLTSGVKPRYSSIISNASGRPNQPRRDGARDENRSKAAYPSQLYMNTFKITLQRSKATASSHSKAAAPRNTAAAKAVPDNCRSDAAAPVWTAAEAEALPEAEPEAVPEAVPEAPELEEPVA